MSAGDEAANLSRQEQAKRLLAEYARRAQSGESITRRQILEENPQLADELAAYIDEYVSSGRDARPVSDTSQQLDATIAHVSARESTQAPGGLPRRFGDYELLRELARGGMGVVFEARQVKLGRRVALKMILSGQLASQDDVRRFYTEAQAAAELDHPGIVPVYEVGEHDGQHFFSMGLVSGQSLAQKLSDGPLPPREAATLLHQIATAIHYAHRRGVIHRDLKPQNILLDESGQPRVTDFGLAKRLETESGLTHTGQILGTPSYMPPEQAAGELDRVGVAADIYSLGAILYALTTGRPPFQGASAWETVRQVLEREPVAPRDLNAAIPRDLETICLKCLQKEPRKRYTSAAELADDLKRYLDDKPVLARPVGRIERLLRWRRRNPWIAASALTAVTAAVALICVLAVSYSRVSAANKLAEDKAEAERIARQDADKAKAEAQREAGENHRRNVRLVTQNGLRFLERNDLGGAAAWFVQALEIDRERRVDVAAGRLRLAATLRLSPWPGRVLFHDEPAVDVQLSEAGGRMLVALRAESAGTTNLTGLYVYDTATGQRVAGPLEWEGGVLGAAISPDGRLLATGGVSQKKGIVQLWDAASGRPLGPPIRHLAPIRLVRFSRQGDRLAVVSLPYVLEKGERHAVSAQVFDVTTRNAVSPLIRHPGEVSHVAFGRNGEYLALAGLQTAVWEITSGKAVFQPPKAAHTFRTSRFISDDGGRLITLSGATERRLIVWNVADGNALAEIPYDNRLGVAMISGDGRLVVTASRDGEARVWDAESGAPLSTPMPHGGEVADVTLGPANCRLATACHDGTARVWDVSGDPLTPPLRHGAHVTRVRFSPDARHVITTSRDHAARMWELATPPSLATQLEHGAAIYMARFSPDGRRIVTASMDQSARVWDAGGRPITPPIPHGKTIRYAAFTDDGARIVTNEDWEPNGNRLKPFRVWDAATGRPATVSFPRRYGGPGFSPDGRYTVKSDVETPAGAPAIIYLATLIEAESGKEVGPRFSHPGLVTARCFSPDGRLFATGSRDRTARVWNVGDGKPVTNPLRHAGMVVMVRFSPDGRRLVTCSDDHTARIWDARTGKALTPPMRHAAPVTLAVFSRDGSKVATAAKDNSVRVWEAATGLALTPMLPHPLSVLSLDINPDGGRLLTACFDGRARMWDIGSHKRPLDQLLTEATLLASARVDETAAVAPLSPDGLRENWRKSHAIQSSDSRRDLTKANLVLWHLRQAHLFGRRAVFITGEALKPHYARAAEFHRQQASLLESVEPPPKTQTPPQGSWQDHFRAASNLARQRRWPAAIEKLDAAVNAGADDPQVWHVRGYTNAELGRWDAAEADFAAALEKGVENAFQIERKLAIAKLMRGDEQGYQKVAASLLEKYGDTSDPTEAGVTARVCLLSPRGADDWQKPLKLAKAAFQAGKNQMTLNTAAVAYYRAGQYKNAANLAAQGIQALKDDATALDALVLAMAYHQVGVTDKAKEWRAAAVRMRQAPNKPLSWDQRAEFDILAKEAGALFDPP